MKQLFLILIVINWGCNAQSPVIALSGNEDYASVNGAYYKDTNTELDSFVGAWKYTNGTTSLTIILLKKTMHPIIDANGFSFYTDELIGEYKYIENGVEKINTLSQLSSDFSDLNKYNISGNAIIRPGTFLCQDCIANERKVLLQFSDPDRYILGYSPEMIFQRVDSGGIQKLKLKFRNTGNMILENGNEPEFSEYTIPFGEYTLTKTN